MACHKVFFMTIQRTNFIRPYLQLLTYIKSELIYLTEVSKVHGKWKANCTNEKHFQKPFWRPNPTVKPAKGSWSILLETQP